MTDDSPDRRRADLWTCRDCSNAHIDVVSEAACSACGGKLEYYGELRYENKSLVSAEDAP